MDTADMELVNGGRIEFVKGASFWYCALPHVFEWNGNFYLVEDSEAVRFADAECFRDKDKGIPRNDLLPREFYAHELLDVKTHVEIDEETGEVIVSRADVVKSVTDFVSRWGFAYAPYRDSGRIRWPIRLRRGLGKLDRYAIACDPEDRRLLSAYIATNAANGWGMERTRSGWYVRPEPLESELARVPEPLQDAIAAYTGEEYGAWCPRIVSVAEAASALELSQRAARSVLSWVKSVLEGERESSDFPLSDGWAFANGAATSVVAPADAMGRGCFLSAVFDQLQATLLDPEPWKICGACGKPFKRKQQNNPKAEMKRRSGRKPPRSKYCCEKCHNDGSNWEKRKGANNRIKHQ